MPWLSVNQTQELLLYAVPRPSFALEVQRGAMPGAPKAMEFLFIRCSSGPYRWWLGLTKKAGMVLANQWISLDLSVSRESQRLPSWPNATLVVPMAAAVDAGCSLSIMI